MAKIRPVGVGGWVYAGIHLCLIALALALVGVTAYAISISRDPIYSILIVGVSAWYGFLFYNYLCTSLIHKTGLHLYTHRYEQYPPLQRKIRLISRDHRR